MFGGKEFSEPFCCKEALGGGIVLTDIMAGSVNSCCEFVCVFALVLEIAVVCGGGTDDWST